MISEPMLVITVISVLFPFLSMALDKILVDREKQKFLREEMGKKAKFIEYFQKVGKKKEMDRCLGEYMGINAEFMKNTFKPIVASLAIFLMAYFLLNAKYAGFEVALPVPFPLIGSSVDWIWWYFLISLTIGFVARKFVGG